MDAEVTGVESQDTIYEWRNYRCEWPNTDNNKNIKDNLQHKTTNDEQYNITNNKEYNVNNDDVVSIVDE